MGPDLDPSGKRESCTSSSPWDWLVLGRPAQHTVNPSADFGCLLFNNPGFSCANVGAGTSCCTGAMTPTDPYNNNCGEGLPGGPCYAG